MAIECALWMQWHLCDNFLKSELPDMNSASFLSPEEQFTGLILDSVVFFFVRDCASLTPAELAAVMEEFLAYLVASGLYTETGVMAF